MSEKENEEVNVSFEELDQSKESEKIGEVCCADTDSVIELKIQHRPDELKLGQPIIIESDNFLYYCIINRLYYPINDVAMKFANSPFIGLIPPSQIEGVRGKEFFGLADLNCLKIIPAVKGSKSINLETMREFDTIPPIFAKGRKVTETEITLIYKTSDTSDSIGNLRGFAYEIPIDFGMLVKKPYGIFGRTGIGKSILNKILCLYILKYNVSQLLLFDMQGEYGTISRADKSKGLKFYYQDKVKIYRLGDLKSKDKTIDDAEPFFLYKENLTSGDIIASSQTLKEPTINALLKIEDSLEEDQNLLDVINTSDASTYEVNKHSFAALKNRIIPFNRYKFLQRRGNKRREDSIEDMFTQLKEDKSIVIDFGPYGINRHLYYFVANSITRRLYETYSKKEFTDEKLPPLTVVLEEAHKFLKPGIIHHTIFDRIAREMRKFQLTLAFVDQRPSQIDEEVMSQIANRFVLHLIDTKDIDKIVKNLPNPKSWRSVIAGLQKKQCFVYGDAISVPTIVDVIDYNEWESIKEKLGLKKTLTETIKEIEETDMTKIL